MVEVNEAEVRDMARQLVADVPPDQVDQFEFRGAQFDRGLALVSSRRAWAGWACPVVGCRPLSTLSCGPPG